MCCLFCRTGLSTYNKLQKTEQECKFKGKKNQTVGVQSKLDGTKFHATKISNSWCAWTTLRELAETKDSAVVRSTKRKIPGEFSLTLLTAIASSKYQVLINFAVRNY